MNRSRQHLSEPAHRAEYGDGGNRTHERVPPKIGGRYELVGLVAYQGKDGCADSQCSQAEGALTCGGYHCAICHEPSGMTGHRECRGEAPL